MAPSYRLNAPALLILTLCVSTFATQTIVAGPKIQSQSSDEAANLIQTSLQLANESKLKDALEIAERAAKLREKALGNKSPLYAEALKNIGDIRWKLGKRKEAASDFRKALAILENDPTKFDVTVELLQQIALSQSFYNDYKQAIDLAKRALILSETHLGADHVQVAEALAVLIRVSVREKQFAGAIELTPRLLTLTEKYTTQISDRGLESLAYHACILGGPGHPSADQQIRDRIGRVFSKLGATVSDKPVELGKVNELVISLPLPEYPRVARVEKSKGAVVVKIVVDQCGNVDSAEAIEGDRNLREASVQAARMARFFPKVVKGSPTKFTGTIQYNFDIY